MKIRTGDSVVVISGKDKGKTGQVLRVLQNKGRVVVAGINMRTKHIKSGPQGPGQRVQYEASLDASNVMVIDPKTKKRTRVGFKSDEKKGKQRIAKKSGEVIAKGVLPKAGDDSADKKAAPAKKSTSKKAEKEVQSAEAGEKPGAKKPFWKKVGFGEQAMEEEAEVEKKSHMQEDHSVPEQGQAPDNFNHQRGK